MRRQAKHTSHKLQRQVNGSSRGACFEPRLDKRLQPIFADQPEWILPDPRAKQAGLSAINLKRADRTPKLLQRLLCRFMERPFRTFSVQLCIVDFLEDPSQPDLCLFRISRSSRA